MDRPHRSGGAWAIAVVLGCLVCVNLADHLAGWNTLWLGPVATVVVVGLARRVGLAWSELGLGRAQHRSGLVWGGAAIATIGAFYLAAALIPATRSAFLDPRYHLDPADAVLQAFVVIPLGTVLFEEAAFRSVLWGMLSRRAGTGTVALVTSFLFGLWHVIPATVSVGANPAVADATGRLGSLATAGTVAGTVIVTTLGGLVFAWLRHRSGSLLASVGMHWATNAVGILVALLAWRLVP